jgi:ribonuclease P protein component
VLWAVRDRKDFLRLRALGRRGRSGALTVVHAPASDPSDPPRVAFAVGRRTGSAVVRNRVRRRLRAILRDEAAAGSLAPGLYLVSAGPAAPGLAFGDLRRHLDRAIAQAVAQSSMKQQLISGAET